MVRIALSIVLATALAGCAPRANPRPPASEAEVLTGLTQLTFGSQFSAAGEAYFSPDMRWVIFQAKPGQEPHYQMYVAALRWSGQPELGPAVRISPPHSRNTCGYFSPDGHSLIFASTAGKEKKDEPTAGYKRQAGGGYRWAFSEGMDLFRVDGWQAPIEAALRSRPPMDLDFARHRLTDNDTYDAEGAYSPDGRWICFTSHRDGNPELYAMRADGRDPRGPVRLTNHPAYDGGPFFSPDGRSIAFRADRQKKDQLQIMVGDVAMDRSGRITALRNQRRITSAEADGDVNWTPYWHPDGRHIIYASSRHGHDNYELYLARRDGSRKTRITNSPGFDGLPVFSPDGRWLMWTSKRSTDRTSQIFIARFRMPEGS